MIQVTAMAQWILVFVSLKDGAGRLASDANEPSLTSAARCLFAARLLVVLTLGLSKCAVIAFLRQLFTRNNNRIWRGCTALLLLLGAWTCVSTIMVGVGARIRCLLSGGQDASCHDTIRSQVLRWEVLVGVDSCLEAVLVVVPGYVFNTLQMRVRRKVTVTTAFAFRLGVIGFLVAFLKSYIDFLQHGRASIDSVDHLILQQALLAYALSSATIPCLKNFLGRFQTGDLARLSENEMTRYGTGSHSASQGQSYNMHSLDREGRSKKRASRSHFVKLQPDAAAEHSARVYAVQNDRDNGMSVRSFGSDQMIIRKKTDIDIVHQ
ncbi:hypothetical protein LTR53_003976 [Teratosphaeriaceae sp. CCFEE 6253]|nr:hypothetical protein LTR53_003976 [Teratosphaeriaceae sp. CCFEE 6253]